MLSEGPGQMIVTDFLAQGAQSMQVTSEDVEPAALHAGLRRALKAMDSTVRLVQRERDTYLTRKEQLVADLLDALQPQG